MSRRITKKFIFGFFYLLILGAIGWGLYVGLRPVASCIDQRLNQGEEGIDCGGPCESCDIKNLKPIQVRSAQKFTVGDQLTTLVELGNPNGAYGASELSYNLKLYDSSGVLLLDEKETSFIYPGEIKYIFDSTYNVRSETVTRIEVVVHETIEWTEISQFPRPNISVRDLTLEFDVEEKQAVITGAITNNNPFVLKEANVVGIIKSKFGLPVAASKTLLQDVVPGEERSFRIVVPEILVVGVTQDDIEIFVEVIR